MAVDQSNPFGMPTTQNSMSAPTAPASNPFAATSSATPGASRVGQPASSNPFTSPTPSSTFKNPFSSDGTNTESGFNEPGSSLLNLGNVPSVNPATYQISPQVEQMLEGNGGFSPELKTAMNANGMESAANAGQQQLAQLKRSEAQSGTSGAGKAAYESTVARQTGEQQQSNLRDVEMQDAQAKLSQQNMAAQLEAQAGQGNMQSANQLALSNAQMLYNAMLANQNARINTQNAVSGL